MPAQTIRTDKLPAARADRWERALAELHRIDARIIARHGRGKGARNDTHHPDPAEANRRAAVAEGEAALWRATAEVLLLDREIWREQAAAPPWAALAAITTARFVFSAPTRMAAASASWSGTGLRSTRWST